MLVGGVVALITPGYCTIKMKFIVYSPVIGRMAPTIDLRTLAKKQCLHSTSSTELW